METLLISLHPRHSQNILAGKKTIELRKRPVDLSRFDHILIYETLPQSFRYLSDIDLQNLGIRLQ